MRRTLSLQDEEAYYKVYPQVVREYMEAHDLNDESELPEWFVTAHDINYKDRIAMQAAWQDNIDASISSTINLPEDATVEDIEDIYYRAWEAELKGVTVYRNNCARQGILTTDNDKPKQNANASIELPRGVIIKTDDFGRGLIGKKRTLQTGCGRLHMSTWWDEETGDLVEIYLDKGSRGGCNSFMCGLSRTISSSVRGGISVDVVIDQLKSTVACPSYVARTATHHDTSPGDCCPAAVGNALKAMHEEILNDIMCTDDTDDGIATNVTSTPITAVDTPKCPECGEPLAFEGGCNTCKNCGYSKCS